MLSPEVCDFPSARAKSSVAAFKGGAADKRPPPPAHPFTDTAHIVLPNVGHHLAKGVACENSSLFRAWTISFSQDGFID